MKYTKRNIIGDAGEHLVASRIIKLFGFPCRLTNIDIGIDAEIEIIDNEHNSTGQFFKCQIKTTEADRFHWYVDKIHIDYWNKLKVPVIIFLVHLKTEKIYWHIIEEGSEYTETVESYKIEFSKENLLKAKNKNRFIEISLHKLHKEISEIIKDARITITQDKEIIDSENWDIVTFKEFVYNANKIEFELNKIRKWVKKEPALENYVSKFYEDKEKIQDHLNWVEETKNNVLNDYDEDFFYQETAEANDWE
jgi:hypothetical protein